MTPANSLSGLSPDPMVMQNWEVDVSSVTSCFSVVSSATSLAIELVSNGLMSGIT